MACGAVKETSLHILRDCVEANAVLLQLLDHKYNTSFFGHDNILPWVDDNMRHSAGDDMI